VNLVFLFNFKVLCFRCSIKTAGVQNFEPQLIVKKCFKNNRFFHLLQERVKNYEPNRSISALEIALSEMMV
jgi:hypothetical protein